VSSVNSRQMWATVRPRHVSATPSVLNPSEDTDTNNRAARAAGIEPTRRPCEGRADAESAGVD
jgi:hypothetical protein